MSRENKLTNLIFKNKENSARTQCASFPFLPFLFFLYRIIKKKKKTKTKTKTKEQRTMVTKGKTMKNKDHVRKTQLD